jgi:NAD(P)H-dependent FMN reductase
MSHARVLAISGSLRAASSNTAVVEAAAQLASAGVTVTVYRRLAEIPPFNPDLDSAAPHPAVAGFRAALAGCDALLICSPEYAHGVSGVLKNALDWVVSSGELIDKPIALVNASGRATIAQAALAETLRTMSGRLIDEASIVLPLDGRRLNAEGLVADEMLSRRLASAIAALATAVS